MHRLQETLIVAETTSDSLQIDNLYFASVVTLLVYCQYERARQCAIEFLRQLVYFSCLPAREMSPSVKVQLLLGVIVTCLLIDCPRVCGDEYDDEDDREYQPARQERPQGRGGLIDVDVRKTGK